MIINLYNLKNELKNNDNIDKFIIKKNLVIYPKQSKNFRYFCEVIGEDITSQYNLQLIKKEHYNSTIYKLVYEIGVDLNDK